MDTILRESIPNNIKKLSLKQLIHLATELNISTSKTSSIERVIKLKKTDLVRDILVKLNDLTVQTKTEKQKLSVAKLIHLATELNIPTTKISLNIRVTKLKKTELIHEILVKFNDLTIHDLIILIKTHNIGLKPEIKKILDAKIKIDDVIRMDICLPLSVLFKEHPKLESKFTNVCNLENIKNNIKSPDCIPCKIQGLYILTINKNGIDYIVKLGSFAESQGMYCRICSFGGGNHETGSATNKWFQGFIKKALAEGYTSKFNYYNKVVKQIKSDDLDDNEFLTTPYVMRPEETQLFQKYNASNYNIPPIFGCNCL